MKKKVTSFEDLKVWQKARKFCKDIYPLMYSGSFAKDFALRNQLNRSSGSNMDNFAEVMKGMAGRSLCNSSPTQRHQQEKRDRNSTGPLIETTSAKVLLKRKNQTLKRSAECLMDSLITIRVQPFVASNTKSQKRMQVKALNLTLNLEPRNSKLEP